MAPFRVFLMFICSAILTLFAFVFLKNKLHENFCGLFPIILVNNPKVTWEVFAEFFNSFNF